YGSASSTDGWVTSSSQTGARAKYRFTGRTVAVLAPTNATRGKASIYIDGVYHATVDLYSATAAYRKVVYVGNWAVAGTHTIELRVSRTSARPRVSPRCSCGWGAHRVGRPSRSTASSFSAARQARAAGRRPPLTGLLPRC